MAQNSGSIALEASLAPPREEEEVRRGSYAAAEKGMTTLELVFGAV